MIIRKQLLLHAGDLLDVTNLTPVQFWILAALALVVVISGLTMIYKLFRRIPFGKMIWIFGGSISLFYGLVLLYQLINPT